MIKKNFKYIFSSFVLILIFAFVMINILGNFYEVNDGVYRSGQLNKYNLEFYAKSYNIKTILNLRGESSKEYYKNEIEVSKDLNITHINYPMSNKVFLDFSQTSELVEILKNAKKPLLIHCAGGADRTSLVSALYQYAVANKSIEAAKDEFSLIYGHSPYFRKHVIAMDNSFDNYVKNITKGN